MSASCILVLFLFYVLYEFFKKDTCDGTPKSGWDALKSSASRGTNFLEQKGTSGIMSMGNIMNSTSQGMNPMSQGINTMGQPYIPPSI